MCGRYSMDSEFIAIIIPAAGRSLERTDMVRYRSPLLAERSMKAPDEIVLYHVSGDVEYFECVDGRNRE
jgi:hypothetical protein